MSLLDKDNFDRFPTVRDPARRVTGALLQGMRFTDTCKDCVLILEGMPLTAAALHEQAHWYGEAWDEFGDLLHQRHLLQEFPATPELDEAPDVGRSLEVTLWCLDEADLALQEFARACDGAGLFALARGAEEMSVAVSGQRSRWLQAAKMWENDPDKLSYDKWVGALFCPARGEEAD